MRDCLEAKVAMPSKRNKAQPQSPLSFQFVNANPQSDLEKASLQKLVRTNATTKYWRQRKKSSTLTRSLSQSTQSIAPLSKMDLTVDEITIYRRPPFPGTRTRTSLPTDSEPLQASTGSPVNSLGIGQVDPFGMYPSELPIHVVSSVLPQLGQSLLQTFPPDKGNLEDSVAHFLYQKCLSERMLFHAFIFCQLARNQLNANLVSKKDSQEMIFCRLETVKGINRGIQHNSTACNDENMLAVLALAISGPAPSTIAPRAPSQGPLKALQCLDIYGGALEVVHSHAGGLMKMVSIRGGLDNIKLPGLAQQLSYGDIIKAAQNMTRPVLIFASINTDIEVRLSAVGQHLRPQHRIGKGFTVLKGLITQERLLRLYPVLRKIFLYTLAVHSYVEGTSTAQTLGLMADERNYVQYCLMSLGIDRELDETEKQFSLYDLCRSAAAIYSLLIVFPLPPLAAPFANLGKKIKEQLSLSAVDDLWLQTPRLMLWITVMGAISSTGTIHRSWLVSILVRYTRQLNINSWAEMKECLQEFLWFESTSDVDGVDLWKEIQLELPLTYHEAT